MNNYHSIKLASLLGVAGNFLLLIMKLIVGIISNSQAMLADAFNSAGDIFASLMTAIGNKIANIPKDYNHNFGHEKAEYIFSMFIGISMIIVSGKIFYDGIMSIVLNKKLLFSWWLILTCFATVIIKLLLYLYTKKIYSKSSNILLKSNMIDHRNDCIIATITMLAIFLSKYNLYFLDGITGMGISIWIFISGINIFLESYNVLMDISIDDETRIKIIDIINECSYVQELSELYSIPTGSKYIIVLTITVDGNMSTYNSHLIADYLEYIIINQVSKVNNVIIHIHPILI